MDVSSILHFPTLRELFDRARKEDIIAHIESLLISDAPLPSVPRCESDAMSTNDEAAQKQQTDLHSNFINVASDAIEYVRSQPVQFDANEDHKDNLFIAMGQDGRATIGASELHVDGSKMHDVLYALLQSDSKDETGSEIAYLGLWEWTDWLQSKTRIHYGSQTEAQIVGACLYAMLNLGIDYGLQMQLFDGKIVHFTLRDQIIRLGAYYCDGCRSVLIPPVNQQWRCLHCNDYDLCINCYAKRTETHASDHVFALIATFEEQARVPREDPATGQAA